MTWYGGSTESQSLATAMEAGIHVSKAFNPISAVHVWKPSIIAPVCRAVDVVPVAATGNNPAYLRRGRGLVGSMISSMIGQATLTILMTIRSMSIVFSFCYWSINRSGLTRAEPDGEITARLPRVR
jgi:hypothetical protein